MITYLIIAILFMATVGLAFLEDYLEDIHKMIILVGYIVFMIILATTKDVATTADAEVYEDIFYNNNDILTILTTEPTYIYLSRIVLALGGTVTTMFFIYAILCIPMKFRTIYTMTPYIFTALIIYIPVYFELHDMVQIRAAAAAMCLLASLIPLSKGVYWQAVLWILGGILFHYSAAVYIPFLFIGNRKLGLTMRIIVAAMVPFCFAMYIIKVDLFSFIPSINAAIDYKLESYRENTENGKWQELYPLYLNLYYLAKCGMLYLCLFYYDYLVEKHRMAPILISLFAASVLFLPSMATVPVIASRISDLYGIVDCVVFTFLLSIFQQKYAARITIAAVGLYMLIFNMLNAQYFT